MIGRHVARPALPEAPVVQIFIQTVKRKVETLL